MQTTIGFTITLVKRLREDYERAIKDNSSWFWFLVDNDEEPIELAIMTEYAFYMLCHLEPQFDIHNTDVLQNIRNRSN